MMIWKFPMAIGDEVLIKMPKGAKVLCAQMQGNTPCLWAAVDDHAKTEIRRFYIRGTGHPLEPAEADRHIDTFQVVGSIGTLVFHVFDGGVA